MAESNLSEITAILEDIRKQVAALADRVARLETGPVSAAPPAPAVAAAGAQAPPAPAVPTPAEAPPPARPRISEEDLLAISAAVAAWLGVRAHIRQIRLISSRAWAQEGRVSIQASHQLHQ